MICDIINYNFCAYIVSGDQRNSGHNICLSSLNFSFLPYDALLFRLYYKSPLF